MQARAQAHDHLPAPTALLGGTQTRTLRSSAHTVLVGSTWGLRAQRPAQLVLLAKSQPLLGELPAVTARAAGTLLLVQSLAPTALVASTEGALGWGAAPIAWLESTALGGLRPVPIALLVRPVRGWQVQLYRLSLRKVCRAWYHGLQERPIRQ